ncbi:MAG: hypothetical protein P8Y63_01205 [Deltaproteobacteria bacterium]|jgi:hypothetical protein
MNAIDRVQLLAELENGFCELNHGPGTSPEDHPAIDYVVMPMGYQESRDVEVAVRDMVIPVCAECAIALVGDEWTLIYCFECCSSQWIYRPHAKLRYRHHLLWLRGCPECSNEFGGLYFNGFMAISDEVSFFTNDFGIWAA